MSKLFADWKRGARDRLLWVDFERYAARVFASGAPDWYRNPVRQAATLGQAWRVIPSDVITVDVTAPFLDRIDNSASAGNSPVSMVIDLLADAAPLRFVDEVADALGHSLGDKVELAVKLNSPRDLLLAAGADADLAGDFGVLDDVATALVGVIRKLSEKPFGILQITSRHDAPLSADEYDACEPIFRAAEYYGWGTCLAYSGANTGEALDGINLTLFPECSTTELVDAPARSVGGGLTTDFWLSDQPLESPLSVLYGVIPEGAAPENVIAKMRAIATFNAG